MRSNSPRFTEISRKQNRTDFYQSVTGVRKNKDDLPSYYFISETAKGTQLPKPEIEGIDLDLKERLMLK